MSCAHNVIAPEIDPMSCAIDMGVLIEDHDEAATMDYFS
jgi:hypothetical protein